MPFLLKIFSLVKIFRKQPRKAVFVFYLILRIQMAGNAVPVAVILKDGFHLFADVHAARAARMEFTACGRIRRRRDIPL